MSDNLVQRDLFEDQRPQNLLLLEGQLLLDAVADRRHDLRPQRMTFGVRQTAFIAGRPRR